MRCICCLQHLQVATGAICFYNSRKSDGYNTRSKPAAGPGPRARREAACGRRSGLCCACRHTIVSAAARGVHEARGRGAGGVSCPVFDGGEYPMGGGAQQCEPRKDPAGRTAGRTERQSDWARGAGRRRPGAVLRVGPRPAIVTSCSDADSIESAAIIRGARSNDGRVKAMHTRGSTVPADGPSSSRPARRPARGCRGSGRAKGPRGRAKNMARAAPAGITGSKDAGMRGY